jgi:hypothetical protein
MNFKVWRRPISSVATQTRGGGGGALNAIVFIGRRPFRNLLNSSSKTD